MNRNKKELLKEKLERLDADEHAQVFEIIKRDTETYTKTANGVLVSSDNLSAGCLAEIEKLVSYYLDQRKSMDIIRRQ